MSTISELKDFPAYKKNVIVKHVCDICGREATDPQYGDWADNCDYDDRVTIERVHGYSAYGDDFREKDSFDICPDCFVNVLTPFLQDKGAVLSSGCV